MKLRIDYGKEGLEGVPSGLHDFRHVRIEPEAGLAEAAHRFPSGRLGRCEILLGPVNDHEPGFRYVLGE